jgi:sterol desaturase/sphingolipid hydroxylase (fatty acid hydroxylase superfamily)
MFKSNFLESLSKVPFYVPLVIYIPVIAIFIWLAFSYGHAGILQFIGLFVAGIVFWTLAEYLIHRYPFHYVSSKAWINRLVWIFHGVHHDFPRDRLRLVMPPSASLPLAAIFYFIFLLIFGRYRVLCFFPGFITGYLIYDMMHYALHYYRFKSSVMHTLMRHHALHHYKDPTKAFGISQPFWDYVFGTNFPKEVLKAPQMTE